MKVTLLASSGTIEGIISLIEKYWYSKNIELLNTDLLNEFLVMNNSVYIPNFRVIKKKNRYRFEYVSTLKES